MCRLLLMNASAFNLIDQDLETILSYLMFRMGGHGNGVAALWRDGTTRVAKSIHYDEHRSARLLRRYHQQGATWLLFHTRWATVGEVKTPNCHPFRLKGGRFVLAQNGHDAMFARLARQRGCTDSECLARTWATLHLPVEALSEREGVFVGFSDGEPFVVKGTTHSDLVALWQEDGDAVLLASELPALLYDAKTFSYMTPLGRFVAPTAASIHQRLFDPRSSSSWVYKQARWADDEESQWMATSTRSWEEHREEKTTLEW